MDAEYYDYGPDYVDGEEPKDNYTFGSNGGPYWDSWLRPLPPPLNSNNNLYRIKNNIEYLGDPRSTVYWIEFDVKENQGKQIKDYWENLYKSKTTYHFLARQCTSTVSDSLNRALGTNYPSSSPNALYDALSKDAKSTCGANNGKKAKITSGVIYGSEDMNEPNSWRTYIPN